MSQAMQKLSKWKLPAWANIMLVQSHKKHEKEAHVNIQKDKQTTNNDVEKLVKMIESFGQRLLNIGGERNMMICN